MDDGPDSLARMDQANYIYDLAWYNLEEEPTQTATDTREQPAGFEEPRPSISQALTRDYGAFVLGDQESPPRDLTFDPPPAAFTESGASHFPLPCPISLAGRAKCYTEDTWESHKSRIRQLYIEEDNTLQEVTRKMRDEENFSPSIRMYKTRLAAWGFYKNNREGDVEEMMRLKKARESEGKSSVIVRSGKPVNIAKIQQYLKRKGKTPQASLQRKVNNYADHSVRHILVRTPSPNLSERLSLPVGSFPDKQKILLSIREWHTDWASRISSKTADPSLHLPIPQSFRLDMGQLQTMDSISLLIRRGCKLCSLRRMTEGGSCIRSGFFLLERLLQGIPAHKSSLALEAPVWIFGLWGLLMESIPTDISKMLLAHIVALAQQLLPGLHPVQEILSCLRRVHVTTGVDSFSRFISSVWASSVNEVTDILYSNGLDAAQCLPSAFWMGKKNDNVRLFQEVVLEFKHTESIEAWQQRARERSFVLCDSRQLLHPAPNHRDILVLMWLRRYAVDSNIASTGCTPSESDDINLRDKDVCTIKSAILTRMEISMGKSNTNESNNIRVLSTDMYQVAHLYRPRKGERMEPFQRRHSLRNTSFEPAEAMFRQTLGVETGKGSWLKWLQALEGSLVGHQNIPTAPDYQEAESFVLVQDCRGKGFVCDHMNTSYGEVGISKWGKTRNKTDGDWMSIHLGYLQN